MPKLTAFARERSPGPISSGGELQDLGGGRRVHVLAALEDLLQHLLAGDVGEDAQLDLRVVGRDQPAARPRR